MSDAIFDIVSGLDNPSAKLIDTFYVENDVDHKIFPTPELEELRPKAAVHLSWQSETKTLGLPRKTVSIDLDRWNETVEITIKETFFVNAQRPCLQIIQ